MALGGGTPDGVAVWDLNPSDWEQAACRVAGRNLTSTEWDTYLSQLEPYHKTCL